MTTPITHGFSLQLSRAGSHARDHVEGCKSQSLEVLERRAWTAFAAGEGPRQRRNVTISGRTLAAARRRGEMKPRSWREKLECDFDKGLISHIVLFLFSHIPLDLSNPWI